MIHSEIDLQVTMKMIFNIHLASTNYVSYEPSFHGTHLQNHHLM